MRSLVFGLYETGTLPPADLAALIDGRDLGTSELLFELARRRQREHFGNRVFLRGLIEFTSYCKNDCRYCGLRRSDRACERYRLSEEEILECCRRGWALGYRTFVLQGGEDPYFTDERICSLVRHIKAAHPGCAVTLSVGEKPAESYQRYFDAGADRYLLRHETADKDHYALLHPSDMSRDDRIRCLWDLKRIGFQTGAGMMVGSPYQTTAHLIKDLLFLKELEPEMIGIGPFIPQKNTPFGTFAPGSAELTVYLLGILRLLFPRALIPATTALGTLDPRGREKGMLAGANVVMPNLSPAAVRGKYVIYDGKLSSGSEAAESLRDLEERLKAVGYAVDLSRGDAPGFERPGVP